MKRKYDENTLQALRKEEYLAKLFGVETIIRQIPFVKEKGRIDPRLKQAKDEEIQIKGVETPDVLKTLFTLPVEEALKNAQEYYEGETEKMQKLAAGKPIEDLTENEISCSKVWFEFGERTFWAYRYEPVGREEKLRPCYFAIHGGGWFMGHPVENDASCRYIADRADAIVYDIDYALAPQYRFPAGLDDCWNVLQYLYEHGEDLGIDSKRIAVGGGSAGANLTAALTLRCRNERKPMIALQVLTVPCLLLTDQEVEGYYVTENDYEVAEEAIPYIGKLAPLEKSPILKLMADGYMSCEEDTHNPYYSPLLEKDLHGLPKAIVQVSSLDALWVQGVHYAGKMREAGVEVKLIKYEGLDHPASGMAGLLPQAEDLLMEIVDAMGQM